MFILINYLIGLNYHVNIVHNGLLSFRFNKKLTIDTFILQNLFVFVFK